MYAIIPFMSSIPGEILENIQQDITFPPNRDVFLDVKILVGAALFCVYSHEGVLNCDALLF